MRAYDALLDHIRTLKIVDTHEHLPLEDERPQATDVLAEWLTHYFSCDLVSAGLPEADLVRARDARLDLGMRWSLVAPYWRAAENTGYGRSLALAARDLYGIGRIDAGTIGALDTAFRAARAAGGHYDRVLRQASGIALAIRDVQPAPWREPPEPFVSALNITTLLMPGHRTQLQRVGDEVGVQVHTLADYEDAVRRTIAARCDGRSRTVCLKCAVAYHRSLRFDRVPRAEAERAFDAFFDPAHAPAGRGAIKPAPALVDYLMHAVCRVADDLKLALQVHTGLLEGNGNVLADAHPALLSNLFLEYGRVRFDLFHMGYPWPMEAGVLAKNFPNVFLDMCWGHIVSPEAARRALVEWLDVVPANKISAFGGDYCFVDGIYGHQHLARHNVAAALAQKVADGSMDLARACELAGWLFVDNPRALFGLDRFLTATDADQEVGRPSPAAAAGGAAGCHGRRTRLRRRP